MLVCTPDLRQAGGVTNYYRTLHLDDIEGVEYFAINRDGTRSIVSKAWYALLIVGSFLRKARIVPVNPSQPLVQP